jgi:Ribosomal protein L1p/L10e family
MLCFCANELLAGKFPTPVSAAEDLNNKLTEVRSTIKFQLKKVLCLGVAVGHVQMTDDQVVANVMLSMPVHCLLGFNVFFHTHHIRYQLSRLAAQETLAKCQVIAHKVDDGQTYPPVLNVHYITVSHFTT